MSEEEKKELKQFILDKRDDGKVVVMGLEGPMSMPTENIIQQPTDGLLYDLNRLEETTLTFIGDIKWVNDFAVALVIRKLKSNLAKVETENELLWMYYKANKESDYDSFQEAEKRIKALGGES